MILLTDVWFLSDLHAPRNEMKREQENKKKERGIFERPAGSDCWWINYYADGKQHREKVGRRGDAIKLYQKRKADARRKLKLPELVPSKIVRFADLSAMAVAYAKAHLKTKRDYVSRDLILRDHFSNRAADSITPQEIDAFLTKHCKTAATANRYRAYISLAYRLGMENDKVSSNPARLVRLRTEHNARLRFLSRDEYKTMLAIIRNDSPEHVPDFMVSIYAGMRWGEQYSLTWNQVDFKRKMIRLTQTKNGSARNVPLNSVAFDALKAQQARVPHAGGDMIFPRPGPSSDCRWWFEPALKKAKITEYTWHNNRHTFCSWLAIGGVSTKEIQVLAGHKTIAMAARYAHLSPEATESATERLVTESK
jgi:integrase